MLGIAEDLSHRAELHDLAQIHDSHSVAEIFDRRQVVGDEQVRESELLLQGNEQVDDLGSHREIEHRGRFVKDDQLRVRGEGARNAHALLLATTHLMGIGGKITRVKADTVREFGDLGPQPRLVSLTEQPGGSAMVLNAVKRGLSE